MKTVIAIIVMVLLAASVMAQSADRAELQNLASRNPVGIKASNSLFSLIDLSKIRWSNSYSVSYFSGGSYSGSQGMLHTSMFYPIASNLNLTVDLGVLHNLSGNLSASGKNVSLLPSFSLDYRPTKNIFMSLNYITYNGAAWPYSYRGANYRYNPFGPE